jgi:hypothetical protein
MIVWNGHSCPLLLTLISIPLGSLSPRNAGKVSLVGCQPDAATSGLAEMDWRKCGSIGIKLHQEERHYELGDSVSKDLDGSPERTTQKEGSMISPEAARLVFEKWLSENTLVFCTGDLHSCWSFRLRGRVAVLSDDLVEVRSEDDFSGARLRFSEASGFEYAEPKDASPEIRAILPAEHKESATLVVGLPSHEDGRLLSKLFFMELLEGIDNT